MLKILLTKKSQDFFEYMTNNTSEELVVVSPNPQVADLVRKKFDTLGKNVESITISKFIKNELNSLGDSEVTENYKGKAELILLLGAIWKKIGKGADYSSFKRAFNLLTEFRSFSMSAQVLETVLEHYDTQLAQGVLWLHRFLEEMGIIDEHKSYFLLAERLREGDLPPDYNFDKEIVFYGFDFMTASQVDMLKSFALRDDVYIPIYKDAFDKTQMLDWVRWFDEHNSEVLDVSTHFTQDFELSIREFPKGYFSKALSSLESKELDVVLGDKNLSRENIQEIPLELLQVKIPVDLFSAEHKNLFEQLEVLIGKSELDISLIREHLEALSHEYIKSEQFRELKIVFTIMSTLNSWEELSSDNSLVGLFDLKILWESSLLDLPRVNLATLSSEKNIQQVRSLKGIEELNQRDIVLGIHSGHGSIKGVSANFTENVEKYLGAIGPIRRAEFEMNIFKCKLEEFFSENKVQILIEEGILKHDTSWAKVLSGVNLTHGRVDIAPRLMEKYVEFEIEKTQLKKLSASRLQKYQECPRKYYHQYVSKISPQIDFETELNVLELGQIEHKVIEDYFKKTNQVDESIFEQTVEDSLRLYVSKKNITQALHEEYLVEIRAYTWNVINSLSHLIVDLELDPSFELQFNTEKEGISYSGSIDCFLSSKSGNQKVVIDFKRSNFVFSTFTAITSFEQIQLWFYLQRLIEQEKVNVHNDELIIGYIDLSDQTRSTFLSNSKDFSMQLKAITKMSKFKIIEEMQDSLAEYQEIEKNLVTKLQNEESFLAQPFSSKSCGYCPLSNVCSRGLIHGNS